MRSSGGAPTSRWPRSCTRSTTLQSCAGSCASRWRPSPSSRRASCSSSTRSACRSRRSRTPTASPSARRSARRIAAVPASANVSRHERATGSLPPRRDRVADPAPRAGPAPGRDPRARAGQARRRAPHDPRRRLVVPGALPRTAGHAGRADDRGDRSGRRGRRARARGQRGQDPLLRRHRRLPLQARRGAGRRADARVRVRPLPRPDREGPGPGVRRRGARGGGHAHRVRGLVIGTGRDDFEVSITGLGVNVPERVVTNDELARHVDTSDEWIMERTGIRERRMASLDEALSDLAMPAAERALEQAGADAKDIDLLIVATVTPDMMFPSTGAILADRLGATKAAAYDMTAGCTGFVYALAQAYGMIAGGLSKKALVIGGALLSRLLDWTDRSTLVLFGDGVGAVVLEPTEEQGFLGFELGADGSGGENLWLPGSGSRHFEDPDRLGKMNGREVFKFATRVLVSSAEAVLNECGRTVDEIDVYVPHQANKRIIDHA